MGGRLLAHAEMVRGQALSLWVMRCECGGARRAASMWPPLAAKKTAWSRRFGGPLSSLRRAIRTPLLGMRKAAARAFALSSTMLDELSVLES